MIINEWHLLLLSIYPMFMFGVFRFLVLNSMERERKRLRDLENEYREEMENFMNAVLLEHAENDHSPDEQ